MASRTGAIEAGRAFVELFADDSPLRRGLQRASRRLKAWGASVRQIGLKMAGLGAAIATPLLATSKIFAKVGDDLNKMSIRTGVAVESLSELGFAAEQSGSSLDEAANAILRMNRRIGRIAAGAGTATQVEAMEALGLNAEKLARLKPEQMFLAIAEGMKDLGNNAAAAGLAQRAFGTEVDRILPLLLQGAEGIKALKDEARDMGLTVSTEAAQQAADFTDAMNRLWKVVKRTAFEIGSSLADTLTATVGKLLTGAKAIRDWVSENKALILTVFTLGISITAVGAAIIALGATLASLGVILSTVSAMLGAIGAALAALISPVGVVIAAVGGLATAFLLLTRIGRNVLDWLGDKFANLARRAGESFAAIRDALLAGEFEAAAKVAWASLKAVWSEGTASIRTQWTNLTAGLLAGWEIAQHGIQVAWIETAAFLRRSIAKVANYMADAFETIANVMAKAMLEVRGIIDEDFDVETAKRLADQQSAQRFRQLNREKDAAIAAANEEANTRRQLEDEEHQQRLSNISNANRERLQAIKSERDAAEQELRDATAAARDAIASQNKAQGGGPEAASFMDQFQQMIDSLRSGAESAAGQASTPTRGTFRNIRSLQSGGHLDQIEQNTRKTADEVKAVKREIRTTGLAFA